jgi:hypothetical protein
MYLHIIDRLFSTPEHLSKRVYYRPMRCSVLRHESLSGSCALGVAMLISWLASFAVGREKERGGTREKGHFRRSQVPAAIVFLVPLVHYVALSLSHYCGKIGLQPSSFLGCRSRRIENSLLMEWK